MTRNPDQQIWEQMLAYLRREHPPLCRQWFEEIEPVGLHNGTLRLKAQSDVHRNYLRRHCLDAFNDAARSVTSQLISVRFQGDEDDGPAVEMHTEAQEGLDRSDALSINPDYTFEHFVVGPENRLAHAAAVAVADQPGAAYNPLFIHGGVGLGKTHLLQAICLQIQDANPGAEIYYLSCESFMTQFMEAVQAGQMMRFRHKFRDVDVLVIDDIHFLANRERTQEEFFHTFNSLYQASKQIILSSDAAPEEIPHLEDRLVSRFKWGLVADVRPPCYETRVAILKSKARLRGITMPDDVACHIANTLDTNIRELEGAITKLQMESMVDQRPINMDMAREAFPAAAPRVPSEPTVQDIIGTVTEFYGVRLADLQSKRRQRSIALPRQVCMYLARRHTRHSLEEIGGYFGGRDHTTVMHAVRSIETKCQVDDEFKSVLDALEDRVRTVG